MELKKNFLIGMIHLPPLLSYDQFQGMQRSINKALEDLHTLEAAGFDAVLLENQQDKPHTEFTNSAQVASFSIIANEVVRVAQVPVGIQAMLNDWDASISIAKASGAKFVRIDVFVDDIICHAGEIHPDPVQILAYKQKIYPEVLLFTDIQVKTHTPLNPQKPLSQSAQEAVKAGSDVVVTGSPAGSKTMVEQLQEVRDAIGDFPLFIGGGVTPDNILEQLAIADGAVIGKSIKTDNLVDANRATPLVNMIRQYKAN